MRGEAREPLKTAVSPVTGSPLLQFNVLLQLPLTVDTHAVPAGTFEALMPPLANVVVKDCVSTQIVIIRIIDFAARADMGVANEMGMKPESP